MLKIIHDAGVALDYGLSMILWLHPDIPMTISSRAGLALRDGRRWTPAALIGRSLNAIWPGHTDDAIAADLARAKATVARLEGQ